MQCVKKSAAKLPLSVVAPVYNVGPYLSRCLESILGQTQLVREIICVDDGSTDRSGEILDQYAERYPQLTVLHKENGGLVSARIAGLKLVTSPYVACIDSDDFVEPDMFATLMDIALREDADIVTSGFYRDYETYRMEDPESAPAGVYRSERIEWLLSHIIFLDRFYQSSVVLSLCGKVFRTEVLRRFQNDVNPRIVFGEDYVVVIPAMLHANCICVSGKLLYHYCLRNDSIVGTKRIDDAERIALYFRTLRRKFLEAEERIPNILRQYCFIWTCVMMIRDAEAVILQDGDYLYPFGLVPQWADIILYGAGKVGKEIKVYLDHHGYRVVAWADKSPNRPGVIARENIQSITYDIVLISIIKANIADEAVEDLKQLGVPQEKIRRIDAKLIREAAERELAGSVIKKPNVRMGNDGRQFL